jgi:hypothetical protein
MPGKPAKSERALCDAIYRAVRHETERAVDKLVVAMRDCSDDAVDRFVRADDADCEPDPGSGDDPVMTQEDLDSIRAIRLTHSTAFAHALLQGAADAFEEPKAGLTLLRRLIDIELTELEQDASFAQKATSAGSSAIN